MFEVIKLKIINKLRVDAVTDSDKLALFLPKYQLSAKNLAKYQLSVKIRDYQLTLEGIWGGVKLPLPLNFFRFKFLFLIQFPNALVQLLFVR